MFSTEQEVREFVNSPIDFKLIEKAIMHCACFIPNAEEGVALICNSDMRWFHGFVDDSMPFFTMGRGTVQCEIYDLVNGDSFDDSLAYGGLFIAGRIYIDFFRGQLRYSSNFYEKGFTSWNEPYFASWVERDIRIRAAYAIFDLPYYTMYTEQFGGGFLEFWGIDDDG